MAALFESYPILSFLSFLVSRGRQQIMAIATVFVVWDSLLVTWSSFPCGWVQFVFPKGGAPTRFLVLAFPFVGILIREA